jgi:hypothetical protein
VEVVVVVVVFSCNEFGEVANMKARAFNLKCNPFAPCSTLAYPSMVISPMIPVASALPTPTWIREFEEN